MSEKFKSSFEQIYKAFDGYSPGGFTRIVNEQRVLMLDYKVVESRPNGIEIVNALNNSELFGIDKIMLI